MQEHTSRKAISALDQAWDHCRHRHTNCTQLGQACALAQTCSTACLCRSQIRAYHCLKFSSSQREPFVV